jgi:hypothetical protein
MTGGFRLGIPKTEDLANKGSDEVTALNRAARVAAEHSGASLHKVEMRVGTDDAVVGSGADLEGGTIEHHR